MDDTFDTDLDELHDLTTRILADPNCDRLPGHGLEDRIAWWLGSDTPIYDQMAEYFGKPR